MWKEAATKDDLKEVYFDVICYKGKVQGVEWKDEDERRFPLFLLYLQKLTMAGTAHFKKLCRVEVDLSTLILEQQSKKDESGNTKYFYIAKYWVVLLFNSAELKAQMLWNENGVEKRYVNIFRVLDAES